MMWLPKPGRVMGWSVRLPVLIYRLGLGRLFGRRFLLLVHRGRRSGRIRRTVLEVIAYDRATHESVVVSAWGGRSDWYRNIHASPPLAVQSGGDRYQPEFHDLTTDEAEKVFAGFARRHPRQARIAARLFGQKLDGSAASVRELARNVKMVAFRPRA
jgi:deazaflavin-dependent oxidoreductase (nitroreductase family)